MDTLCRICLCESLEMQSLQLDELLHQFQIISSITIDFEEDLPANICCTCVKTLNGCYKFREKIIQTDQHLRENMVLKREIVHLNYAVKTEESLEDDDDCNNESFNFGYCNTSDDNALPASGISLTDIQSGLDGRTIETYNRENVVIITRVKKNKKLTSEINTNKFETVNFVVEDVDLTDNKPVVNNSLITRDDFITEMDVEKECDFSLVEAEHLTSNQRSRKDQKVQCRICGKYIGQRSLKRHLETLHKPKEFKCEKCDFTTMIKLELTKHKIKHLADINAAVFDETMADVGFCTKIDDEEDMDVNFKECDIETSKNAKVQCQFCHKYFSSRCLKRHYERFHKPVEYECKQCDFVAKHLSDLIRHKTQHTNIEINPLRNAEVEKSESENQLRIHGANNDIKVENIGVGDININSQKEEFVLFELDEFVDEVDTLTDAKVECKICGKQLGGRSLKRHVNMHKETSKIITKNVGNGLYKCQVCAFATEVKVDAINHTSKCFEMIHCEICSRKIKRVQLNLHMRRFHKPSEYKCGRCDFKGGKFSDLIQHKMEHTRRRMCPYCNIEVEKRDLKIHVNTHLTHKEAEEGYANCHICVHKARTYRELVRHTRIHCAKKCCEVCGKMILAKSMRVHLKSHNLQEVVNGEKFFLCRYCTFKSSVEEEAENHRKSHAEKVVCSTCGASVTKYNMKNHMRIHTGDTVKCEVCFKDIKANSYVYHKYSHVVEENTCKLCGKTYTNKLTFLSHMKDHRAKAKKCPFCGKSCSPKFYLDHVRIHTGERPFKCEYCEKAFNTNWALKTHTRQHTDERPYQCTLCPMAFRQRASLRGHAKSKHNVIIPTLMSKFEKKDKEDNNE